MGRNTELAMGNRDAGGITVINGEPDGVMGLR